MSLEEEDVIATDELTITLMRSPLHVGRVSPAAIQSCAVALSPISSPCSTESTHARAHSKPQRESHSDE